MLSNAPGKGIQFEKAPFKLTKEFVDVIGGVKTENFSKFRKLLWKYLFLTTEVLSQLASIMKKYLF
jgi:phosphatidylinositol kinase/protein kinase (PI-3  family)